MATQKEESVRKVYVLPKELADRIVAFQEEKNFPSEVEAVRKLLDEALKHRDTDATLIKRFQSRLQSLRMSSEVARDVLVGHPLVQDISFGRDYVTFTMTGYGRYRINDSGKALESGFGDEWMEYDDLPF